MPAMPELEGARLRVRRVQPDDLSNVHRLYREVGWSDAAVSDGENLRRRERWLDWSVRNYGELEHLQQPPYGDRAIVDHAGTFVGMVGLVPLLAPFAQLPSLGGARDAKFTPEIGMFWAVLPSHQRQGYALEAARLVIEFAFRELHLARIFACTEHDNLASQSVMRRLGMRVERNAWADPPWFQAVGLLENR